MHVWGISVDLDSIAQFLITAFLVLYGLVYVVKNVASKYFVVEASFEGGDCGVVEKDESDSGEIRVDPDTKVDMTCVVCGEIGTKQCSLCKAVRYCNAKCQRAHWHSGHKNNCNKGLVATGDQKPKLKKILFPYDQFVKYYNWNNRGFPPCGLVNCGNSCFANVVLQCLTYTKPLTAYLLEKGHMTECKKDDWCFLCEFEAHVDLASKSSKAFSPVNILSRLPHIGGNLGFGNQEDAHEFMRFAIDSMQSVFLDQFGGEKALHPSSQETTLIQYIFGGHLLSQVKCITCSKVSNRYESMMDLTVEIHGDNDSLEECLDQFTTPEWLDGENKYKCDGCNAYVNARKCLSIQQPPNILTIALKRFQSGRFGKLNKRVTFPETLDLCPYMTDAADGTDLYNLYAVVVHIDMLNASYFGHYICYIKDFRGDWYRIDDCKVVNVDVDEVLSAAAYMLLYCRYRPRESHQMPSEPTKGPVTVEKIETCSTSLQSVATSTSVSANSSWGTHVPVKPFSGCDNGDQEEKDEATSKYANFEHENGRNHSLPPLNGITVYENGHSDQGFDSGCSSSTNKVSLTNGNGHHNHDSVAQSPLCNFQVLPEEGLKDSSDPMEICGGIRFTQKEIGDQEQSEKRPAKRKKEIVADSSLSDVCNTDAPKQRRKDNYEGLFKRGFLNQNGNSLKKKVNKNITDPPRDKSIFMNGNCCSSIVDPACSSDSSPKEKLGSDVEEMLCSDVKGHMNMSTCAGKINDQEVMGSLYTSTDLPSKSPDSSSEGKYHPDIDQLPCNGNYFSADSTECTKNIKIEAQITPSSPEAEHSSANGSLEGMSDRYPSSSAPSTDGKFFPNTEINGEASNISSS